VLGEVAVAASKTDTFLGERYRRIARRRGKKRAIVAVGRSILVIVWHLLSDPQARFHDLGAGFYDTSIGPERAKRNHLRQLEALGYKVTSTPPPDRPSPGNQRHAEIRAEPGYCRVPAHRELPDQDAVPGSSSGRPTTQPSRSDRRGHPAVGALAVRGPHLVHRGLLGIAGRPMEPVQTVPQRPVRFGVQMPVAVQGEAH